MSALSERPASPSSGRPSRTRAPRCTSPGEALYTDDLVLRTKDVLHAYPVQAPHAHARITGLRTEPALAVPGVVRVLTAADVPGVNDAGVKHDEPLFPDEVDVLRPRGVLGARARPSRPPGSGAAAVEVDYEPLPSLVTIAEAIAASSFQGGQPHMERGDVEAGLAASEHVFSGEIEFAGQEHFYLETHCSLAHVDEAGQVFVQSSTQHPSETQEIVAHVLGLPSHEVTVQCLRMGGGVRRQGDAAARVRRDRRARRDPHRPAGPPAAQPHAGHDDVGQAARLPRPLARRLRRRRPPAGARRDADLGRRAGASTCPSRCWPGRCATSTTRTGSRTCA